MAGRSAFARRSGIERGIRGLLALACAIAGYVTTTGTLAQVLRTSDPDRAHALAPNNARLGGGLAERLAMDPRASPADRQKANRLAVAALRSDPTSLTSQVTALPQQIYSLASNSQDDFRTAASAAIIVLLVLVLGLNAVAILIRNKFQKSW